MMAYFSVESERRTSAQRTQKAAEHLIRLLQRFWYPVSLPEDVAYALGIEIPTFMGFEKLLATLTSPCCQPTNLHRFMPRDFAEEFFTSAVRKERFRQHSLFSYYFNRGWLEFVLHFDSDRRLRRLYIEHRDIASGGACEIPLREWKTP